MKSVTCFSKLLFTLSVFCFCVVFSAAADTITKTHFITDPQTIESNGSSFKLGFFYPTGSANRYVGIWYSNASVPNVVWVANRDDPLNDTSGAVKVSEDGNLVVLNGQNDVLWTSNVSNSAANVTVQLLDSGNLVLKEPGTGNILWQSFQHPTDSFLPTMKMTTNPITGQRLMLTSWRSAKDPVQGDYYAAVDVSATNISQIYLWKNGVIYWSSGPWNGNAFIGIYSMNSAYLSGFSVVAEGDGTSYLMYTTVESFLTSFRLSPDGKIRQLDWQDSTKDWQISWTSQETDCDIYGICGAFGICNSQNHPICSCLRGFQPKNQAEWNSGNWTSGCTRRSLLQCERATNGSGNSNADGFVKLNTVKVPDFAIPSSDSEFSCRTLCLENCSCLAFAYDSGVGCMRWTRNLIDMQEFTSGGGTDVYLRVAYSELDKKKNVKTIIIATTVAGAVIIVILCLGLAWRFKAKQKAKKARFMDIRDSGNVISGGDLLINSPGYELQDLPLFSFEELASATNDFHADNKLGQGGFGPVYRGTLPNKQEIAVKRLSSASGQGLEEFMNEVVVISKLQHRNLVRLLGCCTGRQEKILVYEFMPNKSLDAYLFDPLKQKLLPWTKRFQIIGGIGRGLLYLHRDSRLRIIHRDLKASNILLDEELLPKISDFGMARIFGNNQDQANTARVVGTYGYMAPEYAMEGRFSEKSDVYSFGVLALEIVSGRKNTGFYNDEHSHSLLGYAWKLWTEGNIAALIDISIFDPSFKDEMVRCIHIGLLCVQEYEKDRPSVSTVLSMLSSEIVDLPAPQKPAFSVRSTYSDTDSSMMSQKTSSTNNITMTVIEGR